MENKPNILETLITRSLSGEVTTQEEDQLMSWRSESPDNERQYVEFQQAQQLGEQHYQVGKESVVNVGKEWEIFLSNIGEKTETKTIQMESNSVFGRPWFKVAAAVLLLVSIGYILNKTVFKSTETTYFAENDIKELVLPDGSNITLNVHSSLSFDEDFGEIDRKVELTGEAFFKVTKDKNKTFVIETDKSTVQVLGTSFNIKADSSQKTTEVTVATGVVKFSRTESDESVVLNAGERGILSTEKLINKANDDVNFLAWKTKKIVFSNSSFSSVLETLREVYDVEVSSETEYSNACEVTVTFDQQSIESVMKVLQHTLNLEYAIEDAKIVISHIGC